MTTNNTNTLAASISALSFLLFATIVYFVNKYTLPKLVESGGFNLADVPPFPLDYALSVSLSILFVAVFGGVIWFHYVLYEQIRQYAINQREGE